MHLAGWTHDWSTHTHTHTRKSTPINATQFLDLLLHVCFRFWLEQPPRTNVLHIGVQGTDTFLGTWLTSQWPYALTSLDLCMEIVYTVVCQNNMQPCFREVLTVLDTLLSSVFRKPQLPLPQSLEILVDVLQSPSGKSKTISWSFLRGHERRQTHTHTVTAHMHAELYSRTHAWFYDSYSYQMLNHSHHRLHAHHSAKMRGPHAKDPL